MDRAPEDTTPDLPENMICFSAYALSHAFTQAYRPLLEEVGLTYPQYLVMLLLWRGDDRTVKEIGRVMHLASNTLTPMLKRLEAMGLVERARDTADERVVRIKLTEAGAQKHEAARHLPSCVAQATGMQPDELVELARTLDRLQENLSKV